MALNATIEINAAGTSPLQVAGQPASANGAGANNPQVAMIAPSESDDEDAAETKTNAGNFDLGPRLTITPPKATPPAVVQQLPPPQQQAPKLAMVAPTPFKLAPALPAGPVPGMQVAQLIKPQPKPRLIDSIAQKNQLIASVAPRKKPVADNDEIGEGDISYEQRTAPTPAAKSAPAQIAAAAKGGVPPGTQWMIQIGAYANQALAKAQLATYAEKSMDVLGQSTRVVAPFQGVDGHVVFRARFGPFAEREAREVCTRLTQRGQTCYAAAATR